MNTKSKLIVVSTLVGLALSGSALADTSNSAEINANGTAPITITWDYVTPEKAQFTLASTTAITQDAKSGVEIGKWSFELGQPAKSSTQFLIIQDNYVPTTVTCGEGGNEICYAALNMAKTAEQAQSDLDYFVWGFGNGANSKVEHYDNEATKIIVNEGNFNDTGSILFGNFANGTDSKTLAGSEYTSTMEVSFIPKI